MTGINKHSKMSLFRQPVLLLLIVAISLLPSDAFAQKRNGTKGKPRQEQPVKNSRNTKESAKKGAKRQKSAPAKKGKKGSVKAGNESRSELERRQKATQEEIAATRKRIQENEKEVSRNVKELGRLQSEITVIKGEVDASSRRVTVLGTEIKNLEIKINQEEKELERLRSEYLKAVKKMRARRKGNSELAYLFSSKSIGEAQRRLRYLREFSEWRKNRSSDIEKGVKELESKRADLARDKEMQDKALAAQIASQRQLEGRRKEKDILVTELKKNGAALQSHLAKKQSEVNTLRSRVAALIAAEQRAEEERRRAEERRLAEQRERELAAANNKSQGGSGEDASKEKPSGKTASTKGSKDKNKNSDNDYAKARQRRPRSSGNSGSSGSGAAAAPSRSNASSGGTGFASMQGRLPRPVAGAFTITSPFGRHALPDLPDVMYDNPGIDAQVSPGSSALAVYGGKVSGVYVIPGFSTVVIVNHGDYYTVYGNLASAAVKVGDAVRQGHTLGSVAADEDDPSRGMIHFEVWRNREKLNPQAWIK